MIFRHNFLWTVLGVRGVCTLHSTNTEDYVEGGGPSMDLQHDTVVAELRLKFAEMIPSGGTLDEITTLLVPDPGNSAEVPAARSYATSTAGNRTLTSNDLPIRMGGLIHWRTSLLGKSFRGRMFTPPLLDDTELVDGAIPLASAAGQAMTTFANRVLDGNRIGPGADFGGGWDGVTYGPSNFVVYSPTRHRLAQYPAATIINAFRVSIKPSYMSSRDA